MFLLRNPVHLHIFSELVVLTSMIIWMSSYRKRTTSQIEKLLLRIEEQDEKIQRLEQQFLESQQQQRLSHLASSFLPVATPAPVPPRSKPAQAAASKKTPLPVPVVPPTPVPVPISPPVVESKVAETDQDLDQLLQAELAELTEMKTSAPAEDIEELSTEQHASEEHLKKKSPQ